jgi:hypothetical protein
MPHEVFNDLKKVWVCGQALRISRLDMLPPRKKGKPKPKRKNQAKLKSSPKKKRKNKGNPKPSPKPVHRE